MPTNWSGISTSDKQTRLRKKERDKGMPDITINAAYARMIWPFVCKDKERELICGFRVERNPAGGAVIVATNGKSMGVFWDRFGVVEIPGTITLLKTTLAACDEDCTLVITGERAGVYQMWNKETGEGILVAGQDQAVIEVAYPDWRSTIPNFPV